MDVNEKINENRISKVVDLLGAMNLEEQIDEAKMSRVTDLMCTIYENEQIDETQILKMTKILGAMQADEQVDEAKILKVTEILAAIQAGESIEESTEEPMDATKVLKIMDICYERAINGIPGISKSIEELANRYIQNHQNEGNVAKSLNKEKVIAKLIKHQVIKCGTNGVLTGLGGAITMPITIPANIVGVMYIQMRMIAAIAYIRGFNIKDDGVKSLIYVCLLGSSANEALKTVGIKLTGKLTDSMVEKIPGIILMKLNQIVGTKFAIQLGEKNILNIGKVIPGVTSIIGGTLDAYETKNIAKNAKAIFNQ
ncbi:EcsC family protein [Candidatus Epulonipiscium viviparus]|uniref:EcsC family protein n=1 Tax=Candidatus Epulonipiscium viviparus TaxID=420336 RepID=UPI0027380C1E|nr:EcsC family protein [Candidatus Epulopiscium viviparus]